MSSGSAVVYAAPQTPTASEPANRYVLTSITPKGIMAGGDRYVVLESWRHRNQAEVGSAAVLD